MLGESEKKCSKCQDRKARIAFRISKCCNSLREEKERKLQMQLSLRKNGLTSLFKEIRVFEVVGLLQGSRRPLPPRKLRKMSEKGVPGAQRPKTSQKNFFFSGFGLVFDSFFDFFRAFSAPGRERLFRLFSEFSRERGLFDHCRRPTMSQGTHLFCPRWYRNLLGPPGPQLRKSRRRVSRGLRPWNLLRVWQKSRQD